MGSSLPICRIRGIEIGLHWSWALIVLLLGWSLAVAVFPETNPGLGESTYAAMASVAVAVFFSSLLAHELGHAVVAQQEGMEIEGITLWIFGGVARFKGSFPSAGAEFRIAIAGPIVSLLIGIVAVASALLLPLPGPVDGVVLWLGEVNLILLGFNMIPALPLDGGRVLRALLWQREKDFVVATRRAAALGRLFGQGLIAFGIFTALAGGASGGLRLAFIGWVLGGAAEAELAGAETHVALTGIRVREAMVDDPVTVRPDLSLDDFVNEVFLRHRHAAYPVVGDDGAAGLISYRDALGVPPDRWGETRVGGTMTPID